MNKVSTQNLEGIIRAINKNVIMSFLLILFFFIVTTSVVFIHYKNSERSMVSQKIDTTFSIFTTKISQKLIAITMSEEFKNYLNSGRVSRERHYAAILSKIYNSDLRLIAGMDIYSSSGISIFSYGITTKDSVTLDLCYLNRGLLNFDIGNCLYSWKLYFKHNAMLKELMELNPELVNCNNCGKVVVEGKYFGDFPMSQFSGMKVNLDTKNNPSTILWTIVFIMVSSLLILVMWNVNRIKSIFKKYLSDPIIEITSKIKENKRLPQMAVEELAYLTEQIDQSKERLVELEKIKAQEKANEEKVKVMQSLGASIAHELRTPLRSIITGVHGIENLLPVLLKSYDVANNANLLTEVIKPQQIELLRKALTNLKMEGVSANTIIDMLLMKIKGAITETPNVKRQLSISECLTDALQRYGFQELERKLVICDITSDFQFGGDKLLVVHILFNLLKNALYYIAKAKKGKIYIHLEKGQNENMLCFKDTGKGIAKEVLPSIFNRFYSKTEGGVGIGLSFCKMAMEWMGGDITCQSIEDEYTEFVLHFPISKE